MTDEYGAGVHLDNNFDFQVDNTGDLLEDSGVEELEKDLAVQMAIQLEQYLGEVPTANLEAEVLATAANVAKADVRIERVLRDDSSVEWLTDNRELKVNLKVIALSEEQELIFEV